MRSKQKGTRPIAAKISSACGKQPAVGCLSEEQIRKYNRMTSTQRFQAAADWRRHAEWLESSYLRRTGIHTHHLKLMLTDVEVILLRLTFGAKIPDMVGAENLFRLLLRVAIENPDGFTDLLQTSIAKWAPEAAKSGWGRFLAAEPNFGDEARYLRLAAIREILPTFRATGPNAN